MLILGVVFTITLVVKEAIILEVLARLVEAHFPALF
jgi:hypothetical protein